MGTAKFYSRILRTASINLILILNISFTWAQTPTPFECSNLAYQVSGPNNENSILYSYNVSTGARTLLGALPARVNAIGYNTLDNYIWGVNVLTNQVVKIGSNAALTSYTIPNLPPPAVSAYYNVGEVFGDGYLFIYSRLATTYYVVDINPARASTYLQLVDPTAAYTLDTAPFGNTLAGAATTLQISDIVYNASSGLLTGIIDAQSATNAYRRFTINPVTQQVTITATTIAGGGIQNDEKVAFGSIFIDQTANSFYVFANTLGGFYQVNTATNAATLISTAATGGANNNDGASCPNAILNTSVSGTVFHDPNAGNVNNSTGDPNTTPSGLYANLIGTDGNVVAVASVNSSGFYSFPGIPAGDYHVVLSTTNGTPGSTAPTPSLPAGWVNTGEFNGAENTGTTAPVDGVSPVFTVGVNSTDINFGIQQPPVADTKSFTLATTPVANSTISLNVGGDGNSGNVPGNLTGNDPDGGILNSTSTEPYDVTINTLPGNGTLIYDGVPITTAGFLISDYDPTKLEFEFTGSGYSSTSFTYSVHDAAGSVSPSVPYTIGWTGDIAAPILSGTVFHDPNGGNVNNSTGSPNTVPSGLYANLVGTNGNVVAVALVNADGTYEFTDGIAAGDYTVVLSTTNGEVGTTAPEPSLPAGWMNTGEFNGAENTGSTIPVDGISPPFTFAGNSTDINFGIQQPPVADTKSFTLSTTPVANSTIALNAGGNVDTGNVPGNLTGNDPDGGILNSTSTEPYDVTINTLPGNGTLIYDGVPITTSGFLISDYDPTKLEFEFTGSGYSSTSFTYSVHDAAGSVSPSVPYTIGWTGDIAAPILSGTVFHDPNGGNVNNSTGNPNTVPSGLYANLVGTNGNVVAVALVNSDGTYEFTDDIAPGDYTVVLSTTNGEVGTAAPAPSLPTGWMNTGEFNGAENTGSTIPVDGISPPFTFAGNSTNINFGIQQPPTATTIINPASDPGEFSATPPSGFDPVTGYLSIPYTSLLPFAGTDPEDGAIDLEANTLVIGNINSNTQIFYDYGAGNGGVVQITSNTTIPNFDPDMLVFYGALGSGSGSNPLGFQYQVLDAMGAISASANYVFSSSSALPVTLSSFTAKIGEGNTVDLAWTTTEEINSDKFEVEHSINGKNWTLIASVGSKGESKKLSGYSYVHAKPSNGENLYRLRMVDLDGTYSFSSIRAVSVENATARISTYPNPVQEELTIEGLSGTETIKVLNVSGRVLIESQAGENKKTLNIGSLPGGIYLINIQATDGSSVSQKVIKNN